MASQYGSPFDDLLNTGRRQLAELIGPPRHGDTSASGAPDAKSTMPRAKADTVVEGTAAGIAFKLRVK